MPGRVLLFGDCVEQMRTLADSSIDAVVTDPPYGINFMGKAWDGKAIEEAARAPRELAGVTRLTGSADSASRKLIERTGSGFANRAGEAGAYDFSAKGNRAFQHWTEDWAREAFRVLKPGGHILVFGGTRTYHRMAAGVEDAGFEIRDCLAWMYGSGFPKSLDVAKAIDKSLGVERTEVIGVKSGHEDFADRTDGHSAGGREDGWDRPWKDDPEAVRRSHLEFAAASPEAATWTGWGTALKPAFEPIVLARKPLNGTVAGNVLEHGTGALNVDGCRVEGEKGDGNWAGVAETVRGDGVGYDGGWGEQRTEQDAAGRWPANVLLDEPAAALLDQQTGDLPRAGGKPPRRNVGDDGRVVLNSGWAGREALDDPGPLDDGGGPSRFFYCAKVSRAEREAGLSGELAPLNWSSGDQTPGSFQSEGTDRLVRNFHPTVKPIALMRWLCRLVTPPGGTVLDPFLGSGTTGCAAALEGFDFIGCEREPDYLPIAEARILFWEEHGEDGPAIVKAREAAEAARAQLAATGQLDLFADTQLSTPPA